MEQYVEYDTERLTNFCIKNATDSISLIDFLDVSAENNWSDYCDSVNRIIDFFTVFGYVELIEQISVSPCNLKDFSQNIEYNVMYDVEDRLYLGATIMYNLQQKFIMIYLCEYNAKIADSKEQKAFHVEKLMGPFFLDYPINNQEFEESFKIFCHRIRASIKNNSNE